MSDIIKRHDLPAGHFLDTREGMKIAFGILWCSWIDASETDGCAASIAKHVLSFQLSKDEMGEGIVIARKMKENK